MTDGGFLVCGSPLLPSAPGSTQDKCVECGTAVMVAPSGRRRILTHGLRVLCMDCGLRRIEATDSEIAPIEPDQIAEMLAAAQHENARRRRN